jgi:hypothetical protein
MLMSILHESPQYTVTRFLGCSVEVRRRSDGRSVHMQGDDCDDFCNDLHTRVAKGLSVDELCSQYDEVMKEEV